MHESVGSKFSPTETKHPFSTHQHTLSPTTTGVDQISPTAASFTQTSHESSSYAVAPLGVFKTPPRDSESIRSGKQRASLERSKDAGIILGPPVETVCVETENTEDDKPFEQREAARRRLQDATRRYNRHAELIAEELGLQNESGPEAQLEKAANKYRERQAASVGVYVRQTFIAHVVVLIIALGVEILFLALCVRVTNVSPYYTVRTQTDALSCAQSAVLGAQHAQPYNETLYQEANMLLDSQVQLFQEVTGKAKALGWQLYVYEISFSLISFLIVGVIGLVVFAKRSHPAVRSRGRVYLVLLFTVSLGVVTSSLFMSVAYLVQLGQFPADADYHVPEVLNREILYFSNLVFSSFLIAIFFISAYLSVLIMRQRMLAAAFSSNVISAGVKKFSPLRFTLLMTVLGFLSCSITYFIWRFRDIVHPSGSRYATLGLLPITLIYGPVLLYYIFKSRRTSIQFNDFYSNLRTMLALVVTFGVLMTYSMINPHHIISAFVGYSSILRFVVSVQTLDQFATQVIQARWDMPHTTADLRGPSTLTARIFNWTLPLTARPRTRPQLQQTTPSPKAGADNMLTSLTTPSPKAGANGSEVERPNMFVTTEYPA